MKIETPFPECKDIKLIETNLYTDERGFFSKVYDFYIFDNFYIKQINISYNKKKGTVRGLHYQKKEFSEKKLIYCLNGKIIDYLIDLRKNSKTFGKVFNLQLSEGCKKMILVPNGFGHGFQTIEDNTSLLYFHDQKFMPDYEGGINILDNDLKINFLINKKIISFKDKNLPVFNISEKYFEM